MDVEFDLDDYLTQEGRGRQIVVCKKREQIFGPTDPADSIFYVIKGRALIYDFGGAGVETADSIAGKGALLDILALDSKPTRGLSAKALVECRLMKIQVEEVHAMQSEPVFSKFITAKLLEACRRSQARYRERNSHSTPTRLARLLLDLAKQGEYLVLHGISHEILGQLVGAGRQTVTSYMNEFRQNGWVEYNGGLKVYASLANALEPGKKKK